jgi:integrase
MRSPKPKSIDPKIKYVTWRNGRPRFSPSQSLREQGYEGEDLRNGDSTWMTAGQALEWSRSFEQQLATQKRAAGRKPKKKPAAGLPVPSARVYPVSQMLSEWLNPATNPDSADYAVATVREWRYKVNAIRKWCPDVYDAEALALDKEICRGIYDRIRLNSGLATAHGAMRMLGTAIEWAMSRGKLRGMEVNPAHKLKMKTPPPRLRVGSIEEIDGMVAAADAMGWPEIGDSIVFGVWSGQRQNDRLLFQKSGEKNGRLLFKQAKTGAIVSIKKAPELVKRLEAAEVRRAEKGIETDYVVFNERGKAPFQGSYYSHTLLDVRRALAAGLPDALGNPTVEPMPSVMTLTDQDLRDTAVTWLARAGCTIPEICAITGHSFKTATEILKHYLALDETMADSAIDKLTAWHAKERA